MPNFTTLADLSESDVSSSEKPVIKKKSILESKKLALLIGIVGFLIISIIFYFLFHSIGVI